MRCVSAIQSPDPTPSPASRLLQVSPVVNFPGSKFQPPSMSRFEISTVISFRCEISAVVNVAVRDFNRDYCRGATPDALPANAGPTYGICGGSGCMRCDCRSRLAGESIGPVATFITGQPHSPASRFLRTAQSASKRLGLPDTPQSRAPTAPAIRRRYSTPRLGLARRPHCTGTRSARPIATA